MHALKQSIRVLAAKLGYTISRRTTNQFGQYPFSDMKRFVPANIHPLILDVGANVGQTVKRFKAEFSSSIIHSFEPSPDTFEELKKNTANDSGVFTWNCALGASVEKKTFLENTQSDMSSFLQLSETGWGSIHKQSIVDVMTIDRFLTVHQINHVDILKSDTQGYDFEVFKGAEQAMRNNRIGLIYFEFIFSDMYKSLPAFDEVFHHLISRNFLLVSIYEVRHQNNLASWADALFVNKEYYAKSLSENR
jgi:FkbM family methyltransferase